MATGTGKNLADQIKAYESGTAPIETSGWVPKINMPPTYQPLSGDITADVVIVGAGVVGASLALALTEQSYNVAVLESRQPAFGASGRNAGHIRPYIKDEIPRENPGPTQKRLEFFAENRSLIFELCEQYGIAANAERSGYLEVSRTRWANAQFIHNEKKWKSLGFNLSRVSREDAARLSGSKENIDGLYWEDGGSINPYLFTNGLISAAVQRGCRVFGDSPALSCDRQGSGWKLRTAQGSVNAQMVIFCTNGHVGNAVFPELAATNFPLTACALATKPISPGLRSIINPSRATLMQRPTGLAPLVVDREGRLITAQIPDYGRAHRKDLYFSRFLHYLHRAYPESRDETIEMESYWTGRSFNTASEFPQLFQLDSDVFAVVNTGSTGNMMGPIIARYFVEFFLPHHDQAFIAPIRNIHAIQNPNAMERKLRLLLLPAARLADRLGML